MPCRNWKDFADIVEPAAAETKTSVLPEAPGGRLQSDAFEREGIAGVESDGGSHSGNVLHFLHHSVCATDLDGDLGWITAKTVAVNLHQVAARVRTSVRENSQNLRTVAKGVGGDGEPAVLEIGSEVDGTVRDAWRRARLDLSGTGNGDA